MTEAPCVTAVVVTHNSARHIEDCLAALTSDPAEIASITVIDNASSDGSSAAAHRRAGIEVVENLANTGFAAAVNQGAAMHPGDDLLLVNPDARLGPGTVRRLRSSLRRHPEVAISAVRLLHADGSPAPSAWRFPTPGRVIAGAVAGLGRSYRPRESPMDGVTDVGDAFVPFTAVLLRRSVFDRLGGLDERFWVYGEDTDYCFRARRLGARIVICEDAVAHHVGGASSNLEFRAHHQLRGGDLFRAAHCSPLASAVATVALRTGARARLAAVRITGRPRRNDYVAEWRAVARHRPGR